MLSPRRNLALAAAAVLVMTVVGCSDDETPTDESAAQTSAQPAPTQEPGETTTSGPGGSDPEPLEVEPQVVGTFDEPTMLLPRPGDDHLWLAERGGTVRRVAQDAAGMLSAGQVVLDVSNDTSTEAERGLLGMAFDNDGDTVFVSHTDADGDSVVAAYSVTGNRVDAGSRRVMVEQSQPYPNHNGGHIVFGPDDMLWFGLGDGGAADDPQNNAQDPASLLGKIVRVDPDGGDPEIVVSGVRNPWRFSFDDDGSLWIADVGQNAIEEITRLPEGGIEGANLGWSGFEGSMPYLEGEGRRPENPVPPVFQYTHDGGNCSITGGFNYRGSDIARLDGAYLFADYCLGRLRAIFVGEEGFALEIDLGIDVAAPISFGTDGRGEAYVLSAEGDVIRLG